MAIDRTRCKRHPDGRHLVATLTAADELKVTPPTFIANARKACLERFAAKGPGGQVTYYWVADQVEDLAAQRFANSIVLENDEIIPLPFDEHGK